DVCVATEARLREATTLTAGASTSVRSGAGLTLVSEDRMTSWVSVSLAIGILPCVGAASSPPPPQPHLGHAAGGAESRGRGAPGTVTVPLCSRTNASPFWIMLLLSLGMLEHRMIDAGRTRGRAPDYE